MHTRFFRRQQGYGITLSMLGLSFFLLAASDVYATHQRASEPREQDDEIEACIVPDAIDPASTEEACINRVAREAQRRLIAERYEIVI